MLSNIVRCLRGPAMKLAATQRQITQDARYLNGNFQAMMPHPELRRTIPLIYTRSSRKYVVKQNQRCYAKYKTEMLEARPRLHDYRKQNDIYHWAEFRRKLAYGTYDWVA